MGKHFISLLTILAIAVSALGQKQFITSLENNIKLYKPKYAEATNTNFTFNEHLSTHIAILNEEYELSPNAISYYNALSSMKESSKQIILKVHSEIKYVADAQGISDYPEELLWLPFAISAFDYNYNKDGNYGIWGLQYVYATKYGLCISDCIDERQDIKAATRAAVEQLKYNKEKFGTWNYALAAYLYGAANLKRIQAQNDSSVNIYAKLNPNGNNVFDIWCAFISWSTNFKDMQPSITEIVQEYDTISIHNRMHIEQIAAVTGISRNELKTLNSSFHCEIIDGRRSPITFKLPVGQKDRFLQLTDSIIAYKDTIYFPKPKSTEEQYSLDPNKYEKITYTVKQGDYLGKIANDYHVSVSDLQKWNNLSGTNISVGKKLDIWRIKSNSNSSTSQQSSGTTNRNNGTTNQSANQQSSVPSGLQLYETYVVKSGDSPYTIARRYDWATADDILKWNNISDPSKLQIGQKLKIYKKK